jgi:hypothetical protein
VVKIGQKEVALGATEASGGFAKCAPVKMAGFVKSSKIFIDYAELVPKEETLWSVKVSGTERSEEAGLRSAVITASYVIPRLRLYACDSRVLVQFHGRSMS